MSSWEALPERKRRRKRVDEDEPMPTAETEGVEKGEGLQDHQEANRHRVEEEVAKRAASHKARSVSLADDKVWDNFEYLDHTADVQLHAWGDTLKQAMEFVVPCMFNYMTDLRTVAVDDSMTRTIHVEGTDLKALLHNYLDEFLFLFSTEGFTCCRVTIEEFERKDTFSITAKGEGEKFDLDRHPQGTEVKAITYSNMQIHEGVTHEGAKRSEVFVIVDI
ncbi:unnamed protein product [Chrysoparadoxa australica]